MEPVQARISLAGFLLITGAILLNAIYFQSVVDSPDTLRRTGPEPAARAMSGQRWELVSALREALRDVGRRPGHGGGRRDILLMASILSYQDEMGMRLTGEPSRQLLEHLLLSPGRKQSGADLAGEGPAGGADGPAMALIAQIQGALAARGFLAGEIDGKLGPLTRAAIAKFERAHKMPETGKISADLIRQFVAGYGESFTLPQ